MSTRCNTVIHDGYSAKTVTLYRHCDGYLSCAGVDAYKLMKSFVAVKGTDCDADDVANWFVNNGDGEYEHTSGIHGDVNFIYDIYINTKPNTAEKDFFEIEAHDTKLDFKGPGPAKRADNLTARLKEEWEEYVAKCGSKKEKAADTKNQADIYARIGECVDMVWDGGLRDQIIDAVMDVINASKE